MCGIAGILNIDRPDAPAVKRETLRAMADAISHRGPDGEGVFISACGMAGFAHRRLSIIDTTDAAAQPMTRRDLGLTIAFNGEIYNYVELREELSAAGYGFASTSDTEVVLAAYDMWGVGMLERFNGMWAMAIFDARNRVTLLSRDRFGVKPLYIIHNDGMLHFASEIKALAKVASLRPNMRRVGAFFESGRMADRGETFFEGVTAFPQGTYAIIRHSDDGGRRDARLSGWRGGDDANGRRDGAGRRHGGDDANGWRGGGDTGGRHGAEILHFPDRAKTADGLNFSANDGATTNCESGPRLSLADGAPGCYFGRYWNYDRAAALGSYDFSDPIGTFRGLFESAVRLRLRSDVPVGTCLSGGLDSGSIVSVMAKRFGLTVSAFSSVYADRDCDERRYIEAVNSDCRTLAHFTEPEGRLIPEVLDRMAWHQDEPAYGPGLISQWFVMALAKGRVKVLLDGQGADEILGGYSYFFADHLCALFDALVESVAVRHAGSVGGPVAGRRESQFESFRRRLAEVGRASAGMSGMSRGASTGGGSSRKTGTPGEEYSGLNACGASADGGSAAAGAPNGVPGGAPGFSLYDIVSGPVRAALELAAEAYYSARAISPRTLAGTILLKSRAFAALYRSLRGDRPEFTGAFARSLDAAAKKASDAIGSREGRSGETAGSGRHASLNSFPVPDPSAAMELPPWAAGAVGAMPDNLSAALAYSLFVSSIPQLLRYEDRNSMAHSIESRTPFLDYRLVEFALSLPREMRIRRGETKVVLRRAMEGTLCREVLDRRDKMGFPAPFGRWIRNECREYISDLILSARFAKRNIIKPEYAKRLMDEHLSGARDRSWEIWRLASAENWFRKFFD